MKRELFLVALATACGGSPALPEQPPPRPTPAPDVPEPQPSPTSEDASVPEEAVAEERDGDPRGDPLTTDPNAPGESGGSNGGPGKLDPASVHRVVQRHVSQIKACYQQVLQRDPNAKGQLRVQFTIGDAGAVTAAAVERASGISELDQCVASVFVKMQFPRPVGGFVIVHYPFVFASG